MVQVLANDTSPDGGDFLGAGKHHVMIDQPKIILDKETNQPHKMIVEVTALASSNPEMVGKTRTEHFTLAGKGAGRLWLLLCATGITTREQWKQAVAANAGLNFDENALIARQYCGDWQSTKYTDKNGAEKTGPDCGFRIFGLDDAEAKDIPKDAPAYSMWKQGRTANGNGSHANGNGNGNGNGTQQSAQPPKDDFDAFG